MQLEVLTLFPTEKIATTIPQPFASKLPPKRVNAPDDLAAWKAGKHDRGLEGFCCRAVVKLDMPNV